MGCGPGLGKAELDRLTSAVVISRVSVGVDSVDIKYAGELGIKNYFTSFINFPNSSNTRAFAWRL